MQGKALNYNSRLGSWHVSKQVMRSVFERHDFAFKWTFAEFEGATALYSWCLDQLTDAYGGSPACSTRRDRQSSVRTTDLSVRSRLLKVARQASHWVTAP